MRNFSTLLKNRDYPATTVEKHLSEVIFADRKKALEQRNKNVSKKILPFVTQYHPALPNLKNILMGKWQLIQIQPYLRDIFKEPPLISYRKGKSLIPKFYNLDTFKKKIDVNFIDLDSKLVDLNYKVASLIFCHFWRSI